MNQNNYDVWVHEQLEPGDIVKGMHQPPKRKSVLQLKQEFDEDYIKKYGQAAFNQMQDEYAEWERMRYI